MPATVQSFYICDTMFTFIDLERLEQVLTSVLSIAQSGT